jgi:hypothetical protein
MKTYYVRSRTGEIRLITTKAFICPTLRTDLLSVKGLNFQGYSIIHHPDPEESGVFPLIKGKTDKSQSFAFMSKHSNIILSKSRTYVGAAIRQDLWLRKVAQTFGPYFEQRYSRYYQACNWSRRTSTDLI